MKVNFNEDLQGWDILPENKEDKERINNCAFCLTDLTDFNKLGLATSNNLFYYNRKTGLPICRDCALDDRIHKILRARCKLKFSEILELLNVVVVRT